MQSMLNRIKKIETSLQILSYSGLHLSRSSKFEHPFLQKQKQKKKEILKSFWQPGKNHETQFYYMKL